jgi:hypothetical protein
MKNSDEIINEMNIEKRLDMEKYILVVLFPYTATMELYNQQTVSKRQYNN